MTRAEQKKYRRLLEMKQAELIVALRDREPMRLAGEKDPLDSVQSAAQHDMAVQNRMRQWNLLRDVRRALQRIENNTFGFCLKCETEIWARRLAAVPWASYCIECQAAAENHKAGGIALPEPLELRAA